MREIEKMWFGGYEVGSFQFFLHKIGQVNGMCEAKEEWMKKCLGKVKQCIKSFTTTQFQQIPREDNVEANVLAKMASRDEMVSDQIKV